MNDLDAQRPSPQPQQEQEQEETAERTRSEVPKQPDGTEWLVRQARRRREEG